MSKIEVLTFLFQLSFLTFGKDYPITKLTPNQKEIVKDLCGIGAIYHRKEKSRRFYPTKLALILSVSSHSNRDIIETGANDGYIVMDPNFRIYGYTTSNLQATILGLFCKISYRLPNLVVGSLTRESIHDALQNGITSKEVHLFNIFTHNFFCRLSLI
jgi:transcription initiation factor TFIIH subunit 4